MGTIILLIVNNFSLLSSPDGLRRILCNTVLETKDKDTDLLGRVLLADSTLWKGIKCNLFLSGSQAHLYDIITNSLM